MAHHAPQRPATLGKGESEPEVSGAELTARLMETLTQGTKKLVSRQVVAPAQRFRIAHLLATRSRPRARLPGLAGIRGFGGFSVRGHVGGNYARALEWERALAEKFGYEQPVYLAMVTVLLSSLSQGSLPGGDIIEHGEISVTPEADVTGAAAVTAEIAVAEDAEVEETGDSVGALVTWVSSEITPARRDVTFGGEIRTLMEQQMAAFDDAEGAPKNAFNLICKVCLVPTKFDYEFVQERQAPSNPQNQSNPTHPSSPTSLNKSITLKFRRPDRLMSRQPRSASARCVGPTSTLADDDVTLLRFDPLSIDISFRFHRRCRRRRR